MRRIYEHIQTVEEMSLLNGVAFEEFLADVFRADGYEVDTTPKSGDYGADLIMVRDSKKIVVQAKQHAAAAGFDAVKEVHFAKDFYKADEAWVIATHGFTPQAMSAAESTGVRLVSGAEIERMLGKAAEGSLLDADGSANQLEHSLKSESDSSLFTLSGEDGDELLQYHGRERDVVIPSDLGIWFIGSHAFSDPGEYVKWPEGFVDPVCDWARIQSVVVPEGVVSIGFATFKGCRSLRSISLPSTLRSIGPSAFEGCVSLQEVVLPQGIKSIGSHAFEGCQNLSVLVLPPSESPVEVGWDAFKESGVRSVAIRGNYRLEAHCFERCTKLTSVDIESIQGDEGVSDIGVGSIPDSTFELCPMLKDIRLPDTLASIGDSAFAGCISLQSLEIPESVTEIGTKAFYECSRLSSIRIPPGVETIRSETFTRCGMLSEVSLSEGLKSIEKEAFFVCSRMRRISLPTTVEEVASRAFASCDALTDVVMSPNVGIIRTQTFSFCTALMNVILPEGVRTIEGRAFWRCKWLREFSFPASVEMVAPGAFEGCEELEDVYSSPGCGGTFYRSAFLGCPCMGRDDPIRDLPETATLINDARFPSMFDGPAHALHALRFDSVVEVYAPRVGTKHVKDVLVVDRGVAGLNRFSASAETSECVSFCVELDNGCDRGFYSVKGTPANPMPNGFPEGYLEPKRDSYSSVDPSWHGCGSWVEFSVYLYNCHLTPSPSIDGGQAIRLLDAYCDEVIPLVAMYRNAEEDESGRGRRFEANKLATLDALHAKIKEVNAEFESRFKLIGLDYDYYSNKYSESLGNGPAPSERAARNKAEEKSKKALTSAHEPDLWVSPIMADLGCYAIALVLLVCTFCFLSALSLLLF